MRRLEVAISQQGEEMVEDEVGHEKTGLNV